MKKYLCLDLKKIKKYEPLGTSRLFGDPDFSDNIDNLYRDNDFFICQINLSVVKDMINSVYLPPSGMLYFFLDIKNFLGKVIYDDINDINNLHRVAFNEGFNYQTKNYKIRFSLHHSHHDCMFLYENQTLQGIKDDEVVLLKIHLKKFLNKNKKFFLYYVISKDDLMKRNYNNVRTLIIHR